MLKKVLLLGSILLACLACGLADRVQKAVEDSSSNSNTIAVNVNSNKSITDTAVDTAIGGEKIGIPECDEALEILVAQANDPDDNFIVKAGKRTVLNAFRDQLKKSLEENKADKKEVATMCIEFKKNLEESGTNSNSNTSAQ